MKIILNMLLYIYSILIEKEVEQMTKIALLGYGTIGKGVAKMISLLETKHNIKLTKVLDLPIKKDELGDLLVNSIDDIVNDPEIKIVVEVLGGTDFAYNCTKKCLLSKKSVVTANKEVVSKYMDELYNIAKENNCSYLFEASVGGGIPIIRQLIDSLKVNDVTHIYGILNGTTNYILTKMQEEGLSFDNALKLAQEMGFAELNPSSDLEGLDMARKISILSNLAYKTKINVSEVYNYGIANINNNILDDIKSKGYILRFVSESYIKDNTVSIRIEPVLIDYTHPFASVRDEFNAVIIKCSTNDVLEFYGKGAGSLPTATAIASDIIQIIEKRDFYEYNPINNIVLDNTISSKQKFYIYNPDNTSVIRDNIKDEELKETLFYAKIV